MASAIFRFVAVLVLAYLLNLVVVLILIRQAGLNSDVAQAAGIVPYTIFSYLGGRYFFRAVAAGRT